MSESESEIENLYGIDLLMNVHDRKKKKEVPLPTKDESAEKVRVYVDDFKTSIKQRMDNFHPSNPMNDAIDHYIYGIWLYYMHGDRKCNTPK